MTGSQEQRIENGRELDRIVFFSDAVFAIAITLLVLDIRVPDIPANLAAEELPDRLLGLWPKFFSYMLSFLVIISYWMSHHSIFRAIRGYDRRLMWLNSLFLMCIAFLPFPTALLSQYSDQQLVVVIYAGSLAITRLLLSAVWWYASSQPRLTSTDMDPSMIKAFRTRGLVIPLIFLLSIAISFLSVRAAIFSWVLLFIGDLVLLRILRR
jgi:uncharacterized membrane protein